jgi:hypothetical protein
MNNESISTTTTGSLQNGDDLKQLYEDANCDEPESKECNQFLLRKEFLERKELAENPEENDYLYPNLNDPNFIVKIAEKKEFQDTKYDGTVYNIKERADILSNAEFELSPHQAFVRNFLSSQTPYNSLLLFHGLGSGKTCSAIGVCEEQRDYLKSVGIPKRILIVASPNVQDNFRLQLFDDRKLKLGPGGIWTTRGCIGNKLLKEINPMNMKGIPREKVISQIKTLINNSYLFLGYGEFANYIAKTENIELYKEKHGARQQSQQSEKKIKSREHLFIKNLQNEFNNRLIVIDEIHNIRETDEGENKVVATQLMNLVKKADNLRLLLLSATPMYNSYKEIIWLLNLMNVNDRRATIEARDIFDKDGNFKKNSENEEIGKELLIRKATGYVSFVRGDNPYTFPFRVYPSVFSPDNTFQVIPYPKYQMNGKTIEKDADFEDYLKMIQVYALEIGSYQSLGYKYVIDALRKREMTITTKKGAVRQMPSFDNMDSFGYHILRVPLETSIIVYPIEHLEEIVAKISPISRLDQAAVASLSEESDNQIEELEKVEKVEDAPKVEIVKKPSSEPSVSSYEFEAMPVKEPVKKGGASDDDDEDEERQDSEFYINASDLTGKRGLKRIMNYVDTVTPPVMGNFEYKPHTLTSYGRIFSPKEIGKYSAKIKNICENVISSEGILLIYSEYIPGGVIPMALALEELGIRRYGEKAKNLFKEPPTEQIDVITGKPRESRTATNFKPARYILITGNPRLSPDNDADIKSATGLDNKDGHKIKVIIISRAGSEGVDFKFIRQVHILEPWYNMNRIEQIIGRAVRNFSHKDLPFEKRNVQIFMYGTLLEFNEEEAADMYVYRAANYKSVQIGQVTRVLKETAVDCIVNHDQANFSQELMGKTVEQILSNKKEIPDFTVGDAPYSAACDYMDTCNYKCSPDKTIDEAREDTYNETFIMMNSERILQKIRMLMKERFFYKKNELLKLINIPKPYPLVQIYAALTQLVEDSSEFITDKYGRTGYLINLEDYYLFQPSELNNDRISIFDRSVPIDFKHDVIHIDISKNEKQKQQPVTIKEKEEPEETLENTFIQELKKQFQTAIDSARSGEKIARGDEDWYKHCGITMKKMIKDGYNEKIILECLIDHIVDMIPFEEKLELYNYYYRYASKINELYSENSFEFMLRQAMEANVFKTTRFSAIILYSSDKRHIFIWNSTTKKWENAQSEDEIEVAAEVTKKYGIKTEKFAHLVGFIGFENKNKYLVFKVKDMASLRNKGARCDESVKSKKIQILNEIIGEEKYNKENTRGSVQAELCSLQELLLRYYNKEKKDGKIWFLDFELAMIYKF